MFAAGAGGSTAKESSSSAMQDHALSFPEVPSIAALQAHDQAAQACATAAALMRLGEPLSQAVHDAELVLHASESVDADCAVTSTGRKYQGTHESLTTPPKAGQDLVTRPLAAPPLEALKEAVLASIQPSSSPMTRTAHQQETLQPTDSGSAAEPVSTTLASSNASCAGSAMPPTIDPAEFEGLAASLGGSIEASGADLDSEVEVSPARCGLKPRPDHDAQLLANMVHGLLPAAPPPQPAPAADTSQDQLLQLAAHVLGMSVDEAGSAAVASGLPAAPAITTRTLDDPCMTPGSEEQLEEAEADDAAAHAPAQLIGGTGLGAHSGGHLPEAQLRPRSCEPPPLPPPPYGAAAAATAPPTTRTPTATPATASPGSLTPGTTSTQPAFHYMLSLESHMHRLGSRTPGRSRHVPGSDSPSSHPAVTTPTGCPTQPLVMPRSTSLASAPGSAPPSIISSGMRQPPTPVPARRLSLTSSCSVRSQASSSVASSMHSARMSHTSLDELAAVDKEGAYSTSHSSLSPAPSHQLPEWYSPCGSPSQELDLYPLPLPEEAEQQLAGRDMRASSPAQAVDQQLGQLSLIGGGVEGSSPGLPTPAPSMQIEGSAAVVEQCCTGEEADVQGVLHNLAAASSMGTAASGVEAPPVTTAGSAMMPTESELRRQSTESVLSEAAQQLSLVELVGGAADVAGGGGVMMTVGEAGAGVKSTPPTPPASSVGQHSSKRGATEVLEPGAHTGVPQLDAQPALVLALQEQMALHGCVGRAAAMAGALVHAGQTTARAANIAEAALDPADVVDFTDARTNLVTPDTVPDMQAAAAAAVAHPHPDELGHHHHHHHQHHHHHIEQLPQGGVRTAAASGASPFSAAAATAPCLPAPMRTPTSTPVSQPSAQAVAGQDATSPGGLDDVAVVEALQGLPVCEEAHGGTAAALALSRLSEEGLSPGDDEGEVGEGQPSEGQQGKTIMQSLIDEVTGVPDTTPAPTSTAAGQQQGEAGAAGRGSSGPCTPPSTPIPPSLDPDCTDAGSSLISDELQGLDLPGGFPLVPSTPSDGLPALPSRLASSLGGVTPSASFMLPLGCGALVCGTSSAGAAPVAAGVTGVAAQQVQEEQTSQQY